MTFTKNCDSPNNIDYSSHLKSLYKAGFKLVPLSEDHHPVEKWTSIYNNPNCWKLDDFDDQKIISKFSNVASALGKTYIKDSNGTELFLQVLDVDSEYVFNILNETIDRLFSFQNTSKILVGFLTSINISCDIGLTNKSLLDILKEHTFVTKTKEPYGLHLWWLSSSQNKPILTIDCKQGFEFEIKTDKKKGLCTLPPSTHRDDKTFRYYSIGQTDGLLRTDFLYALFVELFKDSLVHKDDHCENGQDRNRNNSQSKEVSTLLSNPIFHDLSPEVIHTSALLLSSYYKVGNRHDFSLHFSGYAYHSKISKDSVEKVLLEISEQNDDGDVKERLATLNATYLKASSGEPVTGGPTLAELMSKVNVCSVDYAQKVLDTISNLWYRVNHNSYSNSTEERFSRPISSTDKQISPNLVDFFDKMLCVSQAKMRHQGRVKVRGKIMQCSGSFKMISTSTHECSSSECDYNHRVRHPRPLLMTNDKEINNKCPKCSGLSVSTTIEFTNAVEMELQDVDNVNDIDRLLVYLFEDNIKSLRIGETVIIEGNISVINKNDNKRKKLIAALYGNSVTYENEKEINLTQKDIDDITTLKKDKEKKSIEVDKTNETDWIEFLVSQFAPQIARNYYPKLGLLLAAVNSGPDEIFKKRDRIHILLVGEPGLAKTKLLEDAVELVSNSKYMSMSNTSGISLTAMIEKDEGGGGYSVRAGSIVLAKNAIFAANEIGDLNFKNQLYLGDIMEEGVTHISK